MKIKNLKVFLLSITTAMVVAVCGYHSKNIVSQEEKKVESEIDDSKLSTNYEEIRKIVISSVSVEETGEQVYRAKITKKAVDEEIIELTDLREVKEFIQKCSNLEVLNLTMQYPGEIGILKNIKNPRKLEKIYLCYNDIEVNLEKIEDFTNLTHLSIYGEVSNLDFLKTLHQLQSLTLDNANIDNIDIVQSMKKLKELTIRKSSITNISILKNMKNLTKLNLSSNANLTDISAIQNLKKLKELNISSTNVSDFSVLKSLPELESLAASNTLFDTNVLEYLPNLRSLSLQNSQLVSIENLISCEKLKFLNINNNQISDISVLIENNFPDLAEVLLENNNIPENQVKRLSIDKITYTEKSTEENNTPNDELYEAEIPKKEAEENYEQNNDLYAVEIQKQETEEDKYILNTINYSRQEKKESTEKTLPELLEWLEKQQGIVMFSSDCINSDEELQILDCIQSPESLVYLEIKASTSERLVNHIFRFSNLSSLIITAPINNIDFLKNMEKLKLLILTTTAETSVSLEDIRAYEEIENVILTGFEEKEATMEESSEEVSALEVIGKNLIKIV